MLLFCVIISLQRNIEKNYEEGDERESIFNDIPALDEKRKTEEKQT
jgi:hypothetical protein